MTARLIIQTIDAHAGEAGRVVLGQDLRIRGNTMAERLRWCEENLEWLRKLVLQEPRGYPALCAPLITAPVNEDSDFGMIVMEQGGFRPMSGSNLICAVTALVETGMVAVPEPETTLRVDTAVGVVEATVTVSAGRAVNVRVNNVPGFVVGLDLPIELPEYGTIHADIVFGGQFYVQAPASAFGLTLAPENAKEIIRAAAVLRAAAAEQIPVVHPLNPEINRIDLPLLHDDSDTPGVDKRHAVVLPAGPVDLNNPATWTGSLDRSPCGTGTSGRIAVLAARGELQEGERYVSESMVGTTFTGEHGGTTTIAGQPATLPVINGRGWIIGLNQLIREADDPFPTGYTLGDIWGMPETPAPVTPNSSSRINERIFS